MHAILLTSVEILCTVAGWSSCGEGCSWSRREKVNSEGAPAFQPSLHANLLDPAPGVCKPGRELREVHPTVVSQVLLLCFSGVRVGLVFFYPFHEYSGVSHPAYGTRVLLLQS